MEENTSLGTINEKFDSATVETEEDVSDDDIFEDYQWEHSYEERSESEKDGEIELVETFEELMSSKKRDFHENLKKRGTDLTKLVKQTDPKTSETLLHKAGKFHDSEACKLLITNGADIRKCDNSGAAPVHSACRKQPSQNTVGKERTVITDVIAKLVDDKLLFWKDHTGSTPLHLAAMRGNLAVCEQLLDMERDIKKQTRPQPQRLLDIGDNQGDTPLHYAITFTHQEVVDLFLARDADILKKNDSEWTALHEACSHGQLPVGRYLNQLVQKQSKSFLELINNCKDGDGDTPLDMAVCWNNVKLVKSFMANGAVPSENSFVFVARWGSKDMLEVFDKHKLKSFESNNGWSVLHYAAQHNNIECAEFVLESVGMDVDGEIETTPLMLAAEHGSEKVLRLLLEKGADVSLTNENEANAVVIAVENDEENVVKLLVNHVNDNGSVKSCEKSCEGQSSLSDGSTDSRQEYGPVEYLLNLQKDDSWQTPLHKAVNVQNLSMVQFLLYNGAIVMSPDDKEETPFLLAAKMGFMEYIFRRNDLFGINCCFVFYHIFLTISRIMETLFEHESHTLEDEDEYANGALHLATMHGHEDVVGWLLDHDVDVDIVNHMKQTPLYIAAEKGFTKIVKMLLEVGAKFDGVTGPSKMTPLLVASRWGHSEIVSVLIEAGPYSTNFLGVTTTDGENCLDLAIKHGHREAAVTILNSRAWNIVLANGISQSGKPMSSPLRRLFEDMPDVAMVAMDRCITVRENPPKGYRWNAHSKAKNKAGPNDNPEEQKAQKTVFVEFNFDYLDDTHTDYRGLQKQNKLAQFSWEKGKPTPAKDSDYMKETPKHIIKEHHPLLYLMRATTKNSELVNHPLVLALIRQKWMATQIFYFTFLVFYALFTCMFTAYMVMADAPYTRNGSDVMCTPDTDRIQSNFEMTAKYMIWSLSGIGIGIEILQWFTQGRLYLEFTNLLDWYTYISTVIIIIDIPGRCGLRTEWQWQMGSVTVLMVWLNGLLFLRWLPGFGIYLVMIMEVFKTFMKFSVVFGLIVLAFTTSNHLLFDNQEAFRRPVFAFVRTLVMVFGELNYTDIFHDEAADVVYKVLSLLIFVIFIIISTMVIMNLMTALAVADVGNLRKHATLVKYKLQIDLSLNIELAMPRRIRKSRCCNVRRELLSSEFDNKLLEYIEKFLVINEGSILSQTAIVEAAQKLKMEHDTQNQASSVISKTEKQLSEIHKKLEMLQECVNRLQKHSDEEDDNAPLQQEQESQ